MVARGFKLKWEYEISFFCFIGQRLARYSCFFIWKDDWILFGLFWLFEIPDGWTQFKRVRKKWPETFIGCWKQELQNPIQ